MESTEGLDINIPNLYGCKSIVKFSIAMFFSFVIWIHELSKISNIYINYLYRLAELTAKDKAKKVLEKSKNDLEAFIFDMNDKLTQEMYEKCSTEAEREKLTKLLSEASDWMYDQEEDATAEVKIDLLSTLT